jgi:hypothetical protein
MNREAGLVTMPQAAQPKKFSISDGGEIFFFFFADRLWVLSSLLLSGDWDFSFGIKQHGCEADH